MKLFQFILPAMAALVTVTAQAQDFSDPRYAKWGDTPEARKENILASNLLKEYVNGRDYEQAARYFRQLVEQCPAASEATFIRGASIYSNKVQRAKSLAEKQVMIDSLMQIYDLRVQYFPTSANYGKAYVLDRKARDYMIFNPSDREGIRAMFKAAADAGLESQYSKLAEMAVIYYKNLSDDYANGEVYPEVLLDEYERLLPAFVNTDIETEELRKQFDGLFASSGVATCENLEKMFRSRLEAAPEDIDLLEQAVTLMSRTKCDSPFFFDIAEKFYAVKPSAETAMMLAQGFQEAKDYNKAINYLREALNVENDVVKRENLSIHIAMVELAAKNYFDAAATAREAINLNPESGRAYFVLAQAYASTADACSGFDRQATFWVAYDTMSKAISLLENESESTAQQMMESARQMLGAYRGNFPSKEECFFNEVQEGSRYTVTCGAAGGQSTTVRSR